MLIFTPQLGMLSRSDTERLAEKLSICPQIHRAKKSKASFKSTLAVLSVTQHCRESLLETMSRTDTCLISFLNRLSEIWIYSVKQRLCASFTSGQNCLLCWKNPRVRPLAAGVCSKYIFCAIDSSQNTDNQKWGHMGLTLSLKLLIT